MTRVLFIGNSYTYQHSVPELMKGFARALAPQTRLETESVLTGGATLRWHLSEGTAPRRISEGETTVQFRAVLQAESLHGMAFAEDPQGGRWYGSWTLTPAASGQGSKPLAR